MSSSFRSRETPPIRQDLPGTIRPAAAPAGAFPDWSERMHGVKARHEAITRNLNTWSSYKSWAERMRNTWEDGAAREESPAGSANRYTPPNH